MSIFDPLPPMSRKEKKEYKKFSSRMNELGLTQRMAKLMVQIIEGDEIDHGELSDLMIRAKLEEMGIDSTTIPNEKSTTN